MQSADWVSAEFACASYRQLKLASLGQVLTISVPTEGMLISVKGIIRQLREQAGDYFGGIEWVMVNRNKNTHSLIS